jgi:hypothetical protein
MEMMMMTIMDNDQRHESFLCCSDLTRAAIRSCKNEKERRENGNMMLGTSLGA